MYDYQKTGKLKIDEMSIGTLRKSNLVMHGIYVSSRSTYITSLISGFLFNQDACVDLKLNLKKHMGYKKVPKENTQDKRKDVGRKHRAEKLGLLFFHTIQTWDGLHYHQMKQT